MQSALFAVAFVVLGACAPEVPGGTARRVIVDSTLPYETLSGAAGAVGQWSAAIGAQAFEGACVGDVPAAGQVWVTRGELPADVLARTHPPDERGVITVQLGGAAFERANTWGLEGLLVHELGHALGLGHSIHGPRDIMHPYCSPEWEIGAADVREVEILRESGAFWSIGDVQS